MSLLYKRYIDDIVGAASFPEKRELQCFIDHVTNFNSSIKYTYTISNNKVTFIDIQLAIGNNHIKSCVHFRPTDSNNYLFSHPFIHLHAGIPFHFRKCCESNVVARTLKMSLQSQIKSRITFLLANAPSISFSQPTKMFTQFTERIFLSHLLRRIPRIAYL